MSPHAGEVQRTTNGSKESAIAAGVGSPDAGRAAGGYSHLPAGRRRAARAAVSGIFFVTGAAFGAWAARVPAVQDQLRLSTSGLAVAVAGLSTGAFAGLPLAGALVAWWGSRPVLIGGAALYLGALPLIPLTPGLPYLAMVLAAFAFGNSVVDVAMNTQGVLVERAYGRPILAGLHAMFSLGGIASAAVGSLAASAGVSIGTHFLLTAVVLAIACAVSAAAILPDPPHAAAYGPLFVLPTRGLWVPGLIAFCALMGEGVMNDWGAVYLHNVADATVGTAAAGFAVFSAGMVVGRLAADRVRARIGTYRFLLRCALLAAVGSAVAIALPIPWAGLVSYALLGLGLAAIIPIIFSHAARHDPGRPGPSIAAVSAVGYVGFLAGPPIMGGIAEATQLRTAMFVLTLLMGTVTLLAPRLRRGATDAPPGPGRADGHAQGPTRGVHRG